MIRLKSSVPALLLSLGVLITAAAQTTAASAQAADAANAKCEPHLLFVAAVKKEKFNPNDPSYVQLKQVHDGPGAYGAICDKGWAVALISRPNVGSTDGFTLFKAKGSTWFELTQTGPGDAQCVFIKLGVPASIALKLAHGVKHSGDAGC